jgi:hypothetical protein
MCFRDKNKYCAVDCVYNTLPLVSSIVILPYNDCAIRLYLYCLLPSVFTNALLAVLLTLSAVDCVTLSDPHCL